MRIRSKCLSVILKFVSVLRYFQISLFPKSVSYSNCCLMSQCRCIVEGQWGMGPLEKSIDEVHDSIVLPVFEIRSKSKCWFFPDAINKPPLNWSSALIMDLDVLEGEAETRCLGFFFSEGSLRR